MDIGKKIQAYRVIRGLSQEALSEQLGVTRQSVSKWELGQSMPDIEKVVAICKFFSVPTDALLSEEQDTFLIPNNQVLQWGLYLIVKDFGESISFYEKLLCRRATTLGAGRFAQFRFDGRCILSIMNERHLPGHDYTGSGDHKFVLNLWVKDLKQEYRRIKNLNIGDTTEIIRLQSYYYFFNLIDPDNNIIEITGDYHEEV